MVKAAALQGQRFGSLLVTARAAENASGGKARWNCSCDCGALVIVTATNLVRGNTKSCGCLQRRRASEGRTIDLTDGRFGRLVAIRRDGNIRDSAAWVCRCDCGVEKRFSADVLRRGNAASCGCAARDRTTVRPEHARRRQAAIARRRRREDPKYKISADMRKRLHETLRTAGLSKAAGTFAVLGYSREDLFDRLMATMPNGRSWSDYLAGGLHIDHIRPLAKFSYTSTSDAEFKAAWALTNLQLLDADENRAKGAR